MKQKSETVKVELSREEFALIEDALYGAKNAERALQAAIPHLHNAWREKLLSEETVEAMLSGFNAGISETAVRQVLGAALNAAFPQEEETR